MILLKFESDARTIQIIANSLNFKEMSQAHDREQKRAKYMCNLGYLYPERSERLKNVENAKALKEAIEGTDYQRVLADVDLEQGIKGNEAEVKDATLDEVMQMESARQYSMAFENGFHFGVFYGYLKLKELEIKNVTWLSELVSMNLARNMPGWTKYTVPFMYHRNA